MLATILKNMKCTSNFLRAPRPALSWRKWKSASERVSERVSESECFQRFLEVFRGFSEVFQRPSQRQISPLRGSQSWCPYSFAPGVFFFPTKGLKIEKFKIDLRIEHFQARLKI